MLLNTSFDGRGEPVVNNPQNALDTFKNCGVYTLVMGNIITDKA